MSALTSPRCSLGITYCVLFLHPLFLLSQPLQPVQICFAGASAPPSPSGATRAELGLSTHCSLRPGPGTAVVDPRHVPAGSAFSRSDLRTVSPPNTGTHRLVLPSGRCLTPFRERNGTAVHNYSHPAQTEEGSGFPVSGCSLAAWFSRVPEHFFCHWECSRRVSCRPSSTALYPSGCATAAVHALAFLPSRSRRSGYCPGIPRARWTVDYPTTPTFSVHICTSSHSVSHRCRTPRSGSTPDNLLSQRSFHLLRRSGHFRLLRKAGPCKVAGLTSPIGLGPGSSCGRSCLEALHVSRLFLLCLSFLFPVFSRSSVCFFSTISRDAASHEGWSARVRCTSTWEPPILEHQFQTREAVSGSRRTQSKSLVAVYSNVLGERLTSSESADPPHVRKPRGARRDRHFCLPTHSSSCTSLPELAGAGRRIAHARVAACSIERPQSTVQSSPSTAVSVSLQDRKASPKETASFTQKDAGGETLCESEPSLRSSTVGLEIPLKVNSRPTFTPEHIKGVESAEKCYSVPLSYFLTRPLRSLRGISEIRSRILASQANVSSCFDLLLFLPLKYVEIQRGGANEPWSSRNPKCPSAECKEARDGTRSLDAVTRSDGSFEKHSSSREREDGRNTSLQASSEICGTRESQGIGPACLRLKTVDGDFSSPQLAGDRFRETGTGPGDSVKHAEERAASAQPVGETYVRERQQQPCITNSRGPLDLSGSSEIKCTRQTWEEQQERLREQLRVSLVGYLKEQDGDEECPMGRGQVARDKVSEDSSAGQESFCSRNTEKRRTSWTGNETAIIGCIEKISHCRLRSRRSFRGRPMMISTAMVRNMWFSAEESHNTSRRGDLKEPLPVDPKMSASFEKGSLTLPVAEQGASEGGANAGGTAKEPSTESSYAPRTITATWVNQFLKLVKLKKRHIICLIGKLDRVKSGRLKMQNPKVHLVAASEDAFFKSGTVLPDPENLVTGVTATAGAGACDGQGGEPLFRLCSEAAEGASIADGRESQGLHASELEKPGETPELLSQQASQKHESARQEGLGSWRLPSASSSDSRLSLTHTQEEAGGLPCVHISGPSETQKRSQVEHVSTSAGLLPEPDALSGQTGGTGKRRRDFSQQKEFKGGSTKPAQERQAVCTGAGFSLLSGAHSFVPVYPSVAGVPAKVIRAGIETLLSEGTIADLVPQRLRERRGLASLDETIRALHAPKTTDEIRLARKDLFYTSMLWLQLARKLRTREVEDEFPGYANRGGDEALKTFIASLPFKLTLSQLLAVKEIQQDMESTRPMRRLLQGDVGSGKTVVAAAALLLAAAAGQQAALLAPTAALARQHQYNLQRFLGPSGFQVHLLVSDAPDKDRTIDLINSGKAAITVGTHALLQSYVEFPRLGLVVVDEQQKFGVNQRWKLLLQKANATSRRHLGDNVDAPFREKEKEAERANPELSPDDSGSSLGDGETEERISTMQRDSTGSGDFSHLTGEVAVSVTKRESVLSLSPGNTTELGGTSSGVTAFGSTQSKESGENVFKRERGTPSCGLKGLSPWAAVQAEEADQREETVKGVQTFVNSRSCNSQGNDGEDSLSNLEPENQVPLGASGAFGGGQPQKEATKFAEPFKGYDDKERENLQADRGGPMYTGRTADVLLMSATPIPRTQVLLKYGDLQLSRIGSELIASSRASAAWTSTDGRVGSSAENEEGPCRQLYKTQRGGANRIPAHNVSTYLIDRRRDDEVTEMMRIVKEEVRKGRQVFWVCPLVSVAPGGTTPETKRKPCSLRRGRAHNEPSGERSVRRREKSACAPGKSETEESELAEADNLRAAESPTEAENGEEQDAKKTAYITEGAAVQKFKELKEILPDMRIRLLHGRMKTEEKLEVLNALRTGAVDLLVATTVVEVGIDVPNATVIVIDNAERFGLTQLHQLRGRVGRDSRRRSFCFLLIDRDNKGLDEKAMRRFAAISTTTDGFVLAETDAELRGGGTLFGKRQHGQTDVWLARGLKRNEQRQLLEHATDDAEEIIRVYGEMRQDQQLHNEKRGDSEKIVVASDELPRDCCADQGSLRQGEVGNKVSAVHVDDTDEQCSSENPSVQRTSGDGCAVDKPAVTKSGGPARRLQLSPKELQDVEELVNEVKRIVPPAKVDWLFKV